MEVHLASPRAAASAGAVLSPERSRAALRTCSRLCVSGSVLRALFDRANGSMAYIYFSGQSAGRAKNHLGVGPGGAGAVVKKDGVGSSVWTPVDFPALVQNIT